MVVTHDAVASQGGDEPGRVVEVDDVPGPGDDADVGQWLRFGISHPCTVFDKWRLLPVLDTQDRVVELIRTFF